MKLKACPRCDLEAFENLKTYKICHNCNYNTEEGYAWDRLPLEEKYQNLSGSRVRRTWGQAGFEIIEFDDPSLDPLFTHSDYSVVRQALCQLPELEREVIFLRFWKRYDVLNIADLLGIRVKKVEAYLNHAYGKLKSLCLQNSEFSQSIFTQKSNIRLAA